MNEILNERVAKMNAVELINWAVIAFFFGLMMAYAYWFGSYITRGAGRLGARRNRASLQKWGVEREIFWPASSYLFVLLGIALICGVILTFFLAFISTLTTLDFPLGVSRRDRIKLLLDSEQFRVTLSIALVAAWAGFWVNFMRLWSITEKVKALNGLREVFHQRFSVPEILSMYESFQPAPPLFWEAYISQPDEEVSEETNRKFREWVAPYRYSQALSHNRFMMVAMGITIGLTGIAVIVAILAWLLG